MQAQILHSNFKLLFLELGAILESPELPLVVSAPRQGGRPAETPVGSHPLQQSCLLVLVPLVLLVPPLAEGQEGLVLGGFFR